VRHYLTANRVYDPPTGRWLQRDPNETAQPIVEAMAMNGEALGASSLMFSLAGLYGDGPNTYNFVRSNPVMGRDPRGLYGDDFGSGFDWFLEGDTTIAESAGERAAFAQEVLDFGFGVMRAGAWIAFQVAASAIVPGAGLVFAVMGTIDAVEDMAQNGLGWANGFSLVANAAGGAGAAAKLFSRFSASLAANRARYAARAADAGDWMQHVGKIGPYKQMTKLTTGFKGEIQAHHIVESRHLRGWKLDVRNGPAIVLPREMHEAFTAELQRRLARGASWSKAEVWAEYQDVYSSLPDWLDAIRGYFE